MSNTPLKFAVIIASTREGRFADVIANWFKGEARKRNDVTLDIVDLIDVDLPERMGGEPTEGLKDYARRIDDADAVVVITPEYNHGYPASLKAAVDALKPEWQAKPVGFVAYGGVSGGLRAVEQLRQVFAELHAMSVRDAVSFPFAWTQFDENGTVKQEELYAESASALINQLVWWGVALRDARTKQAYAA
ncbi:NADPH-dependent FMN reductase [Cucumibacter marinus]|uniref:NADPH-dependent FMN reductase n=1 Tax=Cucumibacter marinus TaxID=1121252 RepID=UPI000411D88A|nr:NAD(P)H-dependent oxidoreductase [Cucumibacter marinus]